MRARIAALLAIGSFWLSLLLHLLLLLGFTVAFVFQKKDDERNPDLYIPSYVASNAVTPVVTQPPAVNQKTPSPIKPSPQKQEKVKEASKFGIEKPIKADNAATSASKQMSQLKPMLPSKSMQGVHLLGDEKIDKSLRTILGRAIASHLYYPTNAIEFDVKGTVLIGFTLHPDGHVTGIQMVKPSNAGILNAAALAAINGISPVFGVEPYVSEPKYLVIGIIFAGANPT